MKKHKKILIKNPKLKNLRNNLRLVLFKVYSNKLSDLNKELDKFLDIIIETGDVPDECSNLETMKQELRRIFNKSICICYICQKMDKDMVYATRPKEWFCIDCYENKLPKNLQEKWEPKYPLSKDQVLEFLDKLNEVADRCKTNLNLSREILTGMSINKRNQDRFLDTLYQYGGHCDCEIILNAYPNIMADFDLDLE